MAGSVSEKIRMFRCCIAIVGLALYLVSAPGQDEPPAIKPVNLPINTEKDEDDPHVSSNNLVLLYASNAAGKWEILSAERKAATMPWAPGKPLPTPKSKEADIRSPFLTPDGKFPQYLYYTSNKDPEKKDKKAGNYDLYYMFRSKAGADFSFENAVIVADTEADEANPWLTADNRQLFFSRKEKDGWQLYVCTRPADGGQLGQPAKIDFPPNFHHATVAADGKTMYLQGSLDGKRWRLFRSTWSGKSWALPEPLTGLNSREAPTGDRSPCLSADGATLYFVSDRPGGKGGLDIWMVPTAQLVKKQ